MRRDRNVGAWSFAEGFKKLFQFRDSIPDTFFDDLADNLVEGDFGAAEAYRIVDELREAARKDRIAGPAALTARLAELLERELKRATPPGEADLFAAAAAPPVQPQRMEPTPSQQSSSPPAQSSPSLSVVLLLGVNGVGKTTTAAKLAQRYRRTFGKTPILAAADTFRAAAADQLKIHGERLGIRVVAHKHGGDPAAVVFDAIDAARSGGGDLIIADTAGRMHTKTALVEELKKIDRIVSAKAPSARYVKLLVLDATTGRNALAQAEIFHQAVALDGVALTKFDSTARGGIAFSLAMSLGLPVVYLCTGEGYDDLRLFDPHRYAGEFVGLA
jgi:fused signal recognition particle receptor